MRYHSIRWKLTSILIITIGAVIIFTWFINQTFAERFYISSEKNHIEKTFGEIKDILADEEATQITRLEEMEQLANNTNIRMMVAQTDNFHLSQEVIFSNMMDGGIMYNEIFGYLNELRFQVSQGLDGGQFDEGSALSSLINKGYMVTQLTDSSSGENAIYLFGYADTGYLVAMRVALESIQTSVAMSSRFLAYIGIFGIIVGSLIMLFVSVRFTRPIKEMAAVADRMTRLDFDARVNVNTKDELEVLGNSMNELSKKLEGTIGNLKAANLELQNDIKEKEEIDAMRTEFISHVSHELKTPIALIQGYAEGLKENISDDEESREFYCDVITDEAAKMNAMVKKLLTLNQIESGNNQLDIQRFDLSQMIKNKLESSQILLQKKDASVIFEEREDAFVWADEFLIEEVFNNYFSNALNHVASGGVIRISYEQRGEDLRVHVYNDGDPIPDADLEKLWEKFYKVDKARSREYGGSGVGLSIVAATMNAHGKSFGVENRESGVDFYFDLDCVN